MWSVGSGCMSGEDSSMKHWKVSVREVNITLSREGLTSASLSLCPGVSGEAGTRLSAQPMPAGLHGHSTPS